jgi:hypothetical protein
MLAVAEVGGLLSGTQARWVVLEGAAAQCIQEVRAGAEGTPAVWGVQDSCWSDRTLGLLPGQHLSSGRTAGESSSRGAWKSSP